MAHDARLINLIANLLAIAAVMAILFAVVVWLAQRPYFTVSRILIQPLNEQNLQYVSPATVKATVNNHLRGNFFFLNLDKTRSLIETTPWVRKAQIRRVWPNTLLVSLEEHSPLALWNQDEMINTWGEIFSANQAELPENLRLPRLSGPQASENLVVQRYAELTRWFAPLNIDIEDVSLSARYAWDVTLSGGVHLALGRDPAAEVADLHGRSGALSFAQRIERFVQSWPALMARLNGRMLAAADLRYPNGFAITLQPVSHSSVK